MKKCYIGLVLILVLTTLTGCLYPEERLEKNQVPHEIQLQTVQLAVDTYQENKNGMLPIKTRNSDTPIFQKYPIDFKELKQNGLLSTTPGNAFEEGGYYQYIIIDAETDPTVKVIDLRITDKIREVNVQLELYRNRYIYPPFGQEVAKGVYEVDYEKLGFDEPLYVESPYKEQILPIVMDTNGKLYVDYRKDVYELLRTTEHTYKSGDDIRYLLTDHFPIAPSHSLPMTVENGEPIFKINTLSEKDAKN